MITTTRTVTAPEFDRDAPAHKDMLLNRIMAAMAFMPVPYNGRHRAAE